MLLAAGDWLSTAFNISIRNGGKNDDEGQAAGAWKPEGGGEFASPEGSGIIMMNNLGPSKGGKGVEGAEEDGYYEAGVSTAPSTPDSSSSSMIASLPAPKLQPVPTCCPLVSLGLSLLLLTAALALSSLLALYLLRPLGIGIIAVLTNAVIVFYCTWRFRRSVLVRQGVLTFFEAVLIMGPLVILENAWWYGVVLTFKLPSKHDTGMQDCGPCIVSGFLDAYGTAGVFEEMVKYLALRHIMNAGHIVHPIALVAYGAWAGSAFEVLESLLYYDFRDNGIAAAIYRSITPLHALTGMLIGATLAKHRFSASSSGVDGERWYMTILVPVLLHGTYDFLDFILPGELAAPIAGLVLIVGGYVYLRHVVNSQLLHEHPMEMDARAALRQSSGSSTRPLLLPSHRQASTTSTSERVGNNSKGATQQARCSSSPSFRYWRHMLLLLVVAPVVTRVSYLAVGALVPPAYEHINSWQVWARAFTAM